MKIQSIILNIIGYAGALAIIVAFTMLSFNLLQPKDLLYLALNLFGAAGILIDAFYHDDYPAGVLHVVFAAVAFAAIVFNYVA